LPKLAFLGKLGTFRPLKEKERRSAGGADSQHSNAHSSILVVVMIVGRPVAAELKDGYLSRPEILSAAEK
jgi:hypothetical protein